MGGAVLDLVCGFIAFAALLMVSFLTRQQQDIRPAMIVACIAFFAAAFYRVAPGCKRPWVTTVLVGFGGAVPVIVMSQMRIAFTDRLFLLSFLWASFVSAGFGAGVRRLNQRRGISNGIATGSLFAVGAIVAVFVAIPRLVEKNATHKVNEAIVPFNLQTLGDQDISSEGWRGRIVVLSFWATWCTPCQSELPEIAKVQAQYHVNSDVLFFAVNSGNHGETSAKAKTYLDDRRLKLNAAIDSFGVAPNQDDWGSAARSLKVDSIPAVFILDRSGRLRMTHLGYDSSEHLAELLAHQIDELLQ